MTMEQNQPPMKMYLLFFKKMGDFPGSHVSSSTGYVDTLIPQYPAETMANFTHIPCEWDYGPNKLLVFTVKVVSTEMERMDTRIPRC